MTEEDKKLTFFFTHSF